MRPRLPAHAAALCALVATAVPTLAQSSLDLSPLHYPATKTVDQVDDYFGTKVADPYRWLEHTDSSDTKQWIAEENALTFGYLNGIPERQQIKKRLTQLWDYTKPGVPIKRKSYYFYTENSGLQNQAVLYARKGLDGERRAVLDPNTLSSDGTVALSGWNVSDNARYLGYAVSASGSDWEEVRVRDLETLKDLPDTLHWAKFSNIAWTKDNKGFFYSRYAAPTSGNALISKSEGQKLYYHRLGEPQSADQLIFERPDEPEWYVSAIVSDDGEYCIISINEGTDPRNRLYVIDLDNPGKPKVDNPIVKLIDEPDASYTFIDDARDYFFIQTDLQAPRGRIVLVDFGQQSRRGWRTLVPEGPDKLESTSLIGGQLVANYLHDAHSLVKFFTLRGEPAGELVLPALGTVPGIQGRPDEDEMFYSFVSFLQPTSVYRLDMKHKRSSPFSVPKLPADVSRYETRQVFYQSKDGTRVPMFITARKGITLDGTNPTILSAYGGFDISITPTFSPARLAWLEMGGIYAVPNLRGGGEYGEEWHRAGMFERKQNVFDDFIAAAEYLIDHKYTSTSKLAIQGGSNGGLLVGAVETQRPDLFGVALPAVGVMDMLRYHKFTVGWGWKAEYGSSDDSTQFQYLIKYSPLQNIRKGTRYPATLITTSDHDDRVVPGHSFKFAATMQAAQAGPAPILIRVETKAGHGAGKPTSKQIDLAVDELAFTVRNLGLTRVTP